MKGREGVKKTITKKRGEERKEEHHSASLAPTRSKEAEKKETPFLLIFVFRVTYMHPGQGENHSNL